MIGLGILLLILGVVFNQVGFLVYVGILLILAGLVLNFIPLGGRRYRVW